MSDDKKVKTETEITQKPNPMSQVKTPQMPTKEERDNAKKLEKR